MNPQLTQLDIPVPPAPILEQAVGYENTHNARYLSLWWEPAGDEAMVSDGFVTFTGHWAGYLAFIHHKLLYHHLAIYNLGSSDDPAEYRLVVDLQERKAYIAKTCDAEIVGVHAGEGAQVGESRQGDSQQRGNSQEGCGAKFHKLRIGKTEKSRIAY